ncbi:MAG: TolC family protein [Aquificaceae bacterium]
MWVVGLLLCLFSLSFSLSLEELLKSAEEKNASLLSKRYAIESAKLQLRADKGLYYPEFLLNYKFSWQSERQSISIPAFGSLPSLVVESSKDTYQSFQAGIRQMIFDGGQRSSKVAISERLLKISEEEYRETLLDLRLEVIRAYLLVLSSLDQIEVIKKQKEAIEADLRQREAFYKEGLVAITDVLQAKVKLAEVERDLRQAEGNYRIALANLSRLTGIEEERLKELEPIKSQVEVPDLKELIDKAMVQRPALRLAKESMEVARLKRRLELSAFYPKAFLEALYNYSDQNPNIYPKGFFTLSAGVSLSFNALSSYYRALSYVEEEKKSKEELKDLAEKIALGIKSAYERLLTARDNLRVAEENLRLAEEFYRLSLEQYRNQIISGTDLLGAEASLTQARKAKVIAYYDLLKAYFELLREVGEL